MASCTGSSQHVWVADAALFAPALGDKRGCFSGVHRVLIVLDSVRLRGDAVRLISFTELRTEGVAGLVAALARSTLAPSPEGGNVRNVSGVVADGTVRVVLDYELVDAEPLLDFIRELLYAFAVFGLKWRQVGDAQLVELRCQHIPRACHLVAVGDHIF